jgi:hypothetical protein
MLPSRPGGLDLLAALARRWLDSSRSEVAMHRMKRLANDEVVTPAGEFGARPNPPGVRPAPGGWLDEYQIIPDDGHWF